MDVGLGRLLTFVGEGGILPAHAANSKSDPHGFSFEGEHICRSFFRRHVFESPLTFETVFQHLFAGRCFFLQQRVLEGFPHFAHFQYLGDLKVTVCGRCLVQNTVLKPFRQPNHTRNWNEHGPEAPGPPQAPRFLGHLARFGLQGPSWARVAQGWAPKAPWARPGMPAWPQALRIRLHTPK